MITDVKVHFFNEPQDMHAILDNACTVQYDNGIYTQIAPSDTAFAYEWYNVQVDTTTGAPTFIPLGNTYNLNLNGDGVKAAIGGNGEKLIALKVKHKETGFTWAIKIPTLVNLSDWQEDGFTVWPMPQPGILSFTGWMNQYVQQANFTRHIRGAHFIGGKRGDLNVDGLNNTADLLLLMADFGQ